MWSLKTGGLWWQVHIYWDEGLPARNIWSFKTSGLSWQWSLWLSMQVSLYLVKSKAKNNMHFQCNDSRLSWQTVNTSNISDILTNEINLSNEPSTDNNYYTNCISFGNDGLAILISFANFCRCCFSSNSSRFIFILVLVSSVVPVFRDSMKASMASNPSSSLYAWASVILYKKKLLLLVVALVKLTRTIYPLAFSINEQNSTGTQTSV